MSKSSILFILNGNAQIGFGHISRIRIIADEFSQNGFEALFLLPEDCPFVEQITENTNDVILVPSFEKKAVDPVLRNLINEKKIEVVLIDLIEFEYRKFEWLREDFNGLLLVSITLFLFELSTRYEHLSFFPEVKNSRIEICPTKYGIVKLFTGSQYLTFRKEFEGLKKEIRKEANKVLITMGGSDPSNLTLTVLEAIINSEYEITIVLSPIAPSFKRVKELISGVKSIRLIERSNNISKEMLEHDILLINGGLTRYESCLAATPFIALSIHKKQYQITKELTDLGVGINLGVGKDLSSKAIQNSIHTLLNNFNLRVKMSKKMKKLFDIHGAGRILNKIIEEKKYFQA